MRRFDLKGSEYDRNVLKNKNIIELDKHTFKDVDFKVLEK